MEQIRDTIISAVITAAISEIISKICNGKSQRGVSRKLPISRATIILLLAISVGFVVYNCENFASIKDNLNLFETIPDDALVYDGHSYYIYSIKDEGLETFDEAELFCERKGGHLAVIETSNENDVLYQYIIDSDLHLAFFGYTDEQEEGNWTWVTGSSNYENWADGQPNNGSTTKSKKSENCAEFYKDTADGTWNDDIVGRYTNHFICEWDKV